MKEQKKNITWYSEVRSYHGWYSYSDYHYQEEMRFGTNNSVELENSEIKNRVGLIRNYNTCPYCKILLTIKEEKKYEKGSIENSRSSDTETLGRAILKICRKCRWFTAYSDTTTDRIDGWKSEGNHVINASEAIVKSFSIAENSVPIEALIHYLKKDQSLVHDISPKKFEKLAQSVFSRFYDCEVIHVGGPGDNGIDLIMINSNNPTLIQVKRRAKSGYVEGINTVREVLGAMILNDYHKGIILTTAKKFSEPSKLAINSKILDEYRINLELMDRSEFFKILGVIKNFEPNLHNCFR